MPSNFKSKNRSGSKFFYHVTGRWTNLLFFCRSRNGEISISHTELNRILEENVDINVDMDDIIIEIAIEKKPLFTCLPAISFLHHAVVMIKTENALYYIEKRTSAIHLKQVTFMKEIAYHSLKDITSERGEVLTFDIAQQHTIRDLIQSLYNKNCLNDTYHFSKANCQHFAISCNGLVSIHKFTTIIASITLRIYIYFSFVDSDPDELATLKKQEFLADRHHAAFYKIPDSKLSKRYSREEEKKLAITQCASMYYIPCPCPFLMFFISSGYVYVGISTID